MVDKHTLAKQYKNYLLERKILEEQTGEKQPLILPIRPGDEIYINTQNPDGTMSVRPRFPGELNYYFRLLSDYKKYELLVRPEADQIRMLTALAERERAKQQPQSPQYAHESPGYAPGSPAYVPSGSEEVDSNQSPGYILEPSASPSFTIVKEPETKSSILTVEKEEEKGKSEGQSESEEGEKEDSNNETKKIIKL
jgi:hypothetical protein